MYLSKKATLNDHFLGDISHEEEPVKVGRDNNKMVTIFLLSWDIIPADISISFLSHTINQ